MHYISDKGLIFLSMTEHYPTNHAFNLLKDLESIFLKQYTNLEGIKKLYSYEIDKQFKSSIKELVCYYLKIPKLNYYGKSLDHTDSIKGLEYKDVG
jgi:hypothetical protein